MPSMNPDNDYPLYAVLHMFAAGYSTVETRITVAVALSRPPAAAASSSSAATIYAGGWPPPNTSAIRWYGTCSAIPSVHSR
jgi:hypothetical protein